MAKSNWKGSSGWSAADDPTGVLGGRTLVASAGLTATAQDYLVQVVGTSDTWSVAHYTSLISYAWPSGTDAHPFENGKLSILSRSGNYSGVPEIAGDCYIGMLDAASGKAIIKKRKSSKEETLTETKLPLESLVRGIRHSLEFSCFGTDPVTLQLKVDQALIANVGDNTSTKILSGDPGLEVTSGTAYIGSLTNLQFTSTGTAPTAWAPTQISTLSLWLDAEVGVTLVTSAVSVWADQSGNSNDAAQTNASYRPTVSANAVNNLSAINFDGTDDHLDVPDAATLDCDTEGVSIFAMIFVNSALGSTDERFVQKGDSYTAGVINHTGASPTPDRVTFYNGSSTVSSDDNVVSRGNFQILGMITKPSGGADGAFWVDGTSSGTIAQSNGADNSDDLNIGAYDNSGSIQNAFQGLIAELVVVKGVLTTSERQKLEGYLAHKYATWPRLPTDHPYRRYAPTV